MALNPNIVAANDLAEVLREAAKDNLDGQTLDDAAQTIERLAAALNWALVALERRGITTDEASAKAILNGDVPTDRAY
jgi:hypothetical protein